MNPFEVLAWVFVILIMLVMIAAATVFITAMFRSMRKPSTPDTHVMGGRRDQ